MVLAAVGLTHAEPEADPAFAYSIGAPLVYTHHAIAPVVTYAAAGCRNVAGALVPCAHGSLPYVTLPGVPAPAAEVSAEEPAVEEARKKREAEADPAVLYSTSVIKNPAPTVYHAPLTYYAPYAYTHPYAYGSILYGRKKREAEAEADAEADPWLVYGYPYAYSHAFYHPYAYHAAGCRNYLGALVPCAGR